MAKLEAINFIENTHKFGSKLGLDNVRTLLDLMGRPHKRLKFIHVAGTNGKGSTSSFISSILMEQGYKVGLFTSPYLEVFNERIRVNNENIPDEDLEDVVDFVRHQIDLMIKGGHNHPTEFELVTAAGMEYFARQEVDFVVLEVGLGGRLDATNIIDEPLVSVITPIGLDHTDYLGDTVEQVAAEKAGIIKPYCPCVIHPQETEARAVIEDKCRDMNAKLTEAPLDEVSIVKYDVEGTEFLYDGKTFKIAMLGEYQVNNAMVALTACKVLRDNHEVQIANSAIESGLAKAMWPGRMELMSTEPYIVIDGAHNLQGAQALAKNIKLLFPGKNIVSVIGILEDKDVDGILDATMVFSNHIVVTEPDSPRKMSAKALSDKIKVYGKLPIAEPSIEKAVKTSLFGVNKDSVVIFFGSLYMIGEVRKILRGRQ